MAEQKRLDEYPMPNTTNTSVGGGVSLGGKFNVSKMMKGKVAAS